MNNGTVFVVALVLLMLSLVMRQRGDTCPLWLRLSRYTLRVVAVGMLVAAFL